MCDDARTNPIRRWGLVFPESCSKGNNSTLADAGASEIHALAVICKLALCPNHFAHGRLTMYLIGLVLSENCAEVRIKVRG